MKLMNVAKKYGRPALVVVGTLVASFAHADLDPAVATAITAVQTNGTSLFPLMYPAMAAVTGGFVIFGLVKKGIKKAA